MKPEFVQAIEDFVNDKEVRDYIFATNPDLIHELVKHLKKSTPENPVTEAITPYQDETIEFCNPEARLYAALARFQAEVKPAVRNAKGQVGQNRNYTYAALNDIWDVIHKPLADNGLAVIQMVGPFEDGKQYLRTIIVHKDGGRIEEQGAIPCSQANAQGAGSAITYLRRYSLGAALGLITEEDDDGAEASKPEEQARDTAPKQNTPARAPERATAPVLSKEQIRETYTEYLDVIQEATLKASDAAVIVGELTKDNAIEKIATYILTTPDMTVAKLVGMILEKKQQEAA